TTTLLVVVPHIGDADDFAEDVGAFAGARPDVFPALARLTPTPSRPDGPDELSPPSHPRSDEAIGQRLRVAKRLGGALPPRFIVAPIQALLQPVPRPEALARASRTVRVGDTAPLEELV